MVRGEAGGWRGFLANKAASWCVKILLTNYQLPITNYQLPLA
ncbi:hypothetical protein [Chroococcidiopsis sp.]